MSAMRSPMEVYSRLPLTESRLRLYTISATAARLLRVTSVWWFSAVLWWLPRCARLASAARLMAKPLPSVVCQLPLR